MASRTYTLTLSSVGATPIAEARGNAVGICQIDLGDAVGLQVVGRLDETMPWQDLLETSPEADAAYSIALFPEMAFEVDSGTATSVKVLS